MQTTIIEYLRDKMIKTADEKGSLTDPAVIEISQQLDGFIVMLQRINLTMRTNPDRDSLTVLQSSEPSRKHLVGFKRGYVGRLTHETIKHASSSLRVR